MPSRTCIVPCMYKDSRMLSPTGVVMDKSINLHGVVYTLRYKRRYRLQPRYIPMLGQEPLSYKDMTEDEATEFVQCHWVATKLQPRRRNQPVPQTVKEEAHDIERLDNFLEFTSFDAADLGDLGLF